MTGTNRLFYSRTTYTTCRHPKHGGDNEVRVDGYASAAEARGSVPQPSCPWARQRTEVGRETTNGAEAALEGGDNEYPEAEPLPEDLQALRRAFDEDRHLGRWRPEGRP